MLLLGTSLIVVWIKRKMRSKGQGCLADRGGLTNFKWWMSDKLVRQQYSLSAEECSHATTASIHHLCAGFQQIESLFFSPRWMKVDHGSEKSIALGLFIAVARGTRNANVTHTVLSVGCAGPWISIVLSKAEPTPANIGGSHFCHE